MVVAYSAYSHTVNEKQRELASLQRAIAELQHKKEWEKERNEELLAHRMSRNDPEYITLLLMKNLGLVAEGQVKVSFQ